MVKTFKVLFTLASLINMHAQYIRPKVTVHKGTETIQGRKLFKGGNYMRKYGIHSSVQATAQSFELDSSDLLPAQLGPTVNFPAFKMFCPMKMSYTSN